MPIGVHECHHSSFVVSIPSGEARPVVSPKDIEAPGLLMKVEATTGRAEAQAPETGANDALPRLGVRDEGGEEGGLEGGVDVLELLLPRPKLLARVVEAAGTRLNKVREQEKRITEERREEGRREQKRRA